MAILSQVVKLGLFFFILFTALYSYQNVVTQLYQQLGHPNIGLLSLFTVYASVVVGGLVAPFIGKRYNFKKMVVGSAICFTLNLSSGIILNEVGYSVIAILIALLAAAVAGASVALLWVAQAGYIHLICQRNGLQHKKGYYFGIFYGIFCMSSISSALITTFMLGLFGFIVYFWILLGIGALSVLFGIFVIEDVQKKYAEQDSSAQPMIIMENQQKEQAPVKILPAIAKVFKYYPKMLPLLSPIGLVGISLAFYASSLHRILRVALPVQANEGYVNLRTGYMFLALGVGGITGGYISGRLSDKLGIQKVGSIALCGFYLAVILSQLGVSQHETVVPVMFAAFFWGFAQAYIQNWIIVVCSRTHKGALEAFVVNKQFHSLILCLYEMVLIVFKPSFDILMPVLLVLGLAFTLSLPFINEQPITNDPPSAQRPTSEAKVS